MTLSPGELVCLHNAYTRANTTIFNYFCFCPFWLPASVQIPPDFIGKGTSRCCWNHQCTGSTTAPKPGLFLFFGSMVLVISEWYDNTPLAILMRLLGCSLVIAGGNFMSVIWLWKASSPPSHWLCCWWPRTSHYWGPWGPTDRELPWRPRWWESWRTPLRWLLRLDHRMFG